MTRSQRHAYERRQTLSSLWYIEEMVYGDIGYDVKKGVHAYNPHFRQSMAGYPDALPKAVDILQKNWSNIVAPPPSDFEELYGRVSSLLNSSSSNVYGVGLVTVYDISLAIGCNLYPKVLPREFVYLHGNCVEESAKILIGKSQIKDHKVPASAFNKIFPCSTAMEIEDLLCEYNEAIVKYNMFDLRWLDVEPNNVTSPNNVTNP